MLFPTEILRKLDYAERRSREHQVQNLDANEESLSWIWSASSSFTEWLSSRQGLYWISGKPGSGKSTLVNYLINRDETKLELQRHSHLDWIVLHFFFDFREGKGTANSFEGLLRSLLYQLIQQMPQVDVFGLSDCGHESFSGWPVHRLRDALGKTLQNANNAVCIFVDGLDEYEGSILELIQYLESLTTRIGSQVTSTKICVSSRPEPTPSQLLQHVLHLSLSDHNEPGIRLHCLATLEGLEHVVFKDLDISRLSQIIARRAEGVFLWARFALEELIMGDISGETLAEIRVRLDLIPGDLQDVYDRMVRRMEPLAKKECLAMLQLVCFAKRPLFWQEHLVATHIAMGKDAIHERIRGDEISAKTYSTFAKRLREKAVGLLELVEYKYRPGEEHLIVKLIHRTVSTYLNQKGWQTLGESERYDSIRHESFFVNTCTQYLHSLLRHCKMEMNTSRSVWKKWYNNKILGYPEGIYLRDDLVGKYPFFTYAAAYLFEHAKALQRHGAASYPQLHEIMTEEIVSLHVLSQEKNIMNDVTCWPCRQAPWNLIFEDFDATCVGFLHGFESYCRSNLATKQPAPGQVFWDKALRCAIHTGKLSVWDGGEEDEGIVSLALQHVDAVQEVHIKDLLMCERAECFRKTRFVELVLHHESVEHVRLTNNDGQPVNLLWFFANCSMCSDVERLWISLIEAAHRRGDNVREPCGPEGNAVEILLGKDPSDHRKHKLQLLRRYYELMSWPFEYDSDEIEEGSEIGDSDQDSDEQDEDPGSEARHLELDILR